MTKPLKPIDPVKGQMPLFPTPASIWRCLHCPCGGPGDPATCEAKADKHTQLTGHPTTTEWKD